MVAPRLRVAVAAACSRARWRASSPHSRSYGRPPRAATAPKPGADLAARYAAIISPSTDDVEGGGDSKDMYVTGRNTPLGARRILSVEEQYEKLRDGTLE